MTKFNNIKKVCFLLSFMIFSLLGCTNKDILSEAKIKEPLQNTEETIQLRITTMFGDTDPAAEVYQASLEDFMSNHPSVKVTDESLLAGEAFRTKVKTDFAAGNEADVTFFFTGPDAWTLINSGNVLPFDSFLEEDPDWSQGLLLSQMENMRDENGHLYAIPVTGFYEGLYCNADLFESYDIPLPKTWDDFVYAIEQFHENNIIPLSASLEESYYLIDAFILSAGGESGHNSAFTTGIHDSWINGMNYIKTIYEANAFSKDSFTINDVAAQELFQEKKAAMMINGSWAIHGLPDKNHTTLLPLPVIPKGKAHPTDIIGGYTSGYFLSKKSYEDVSKKGMALELIKYLTTPEKIKVFAEANGGIPNADVQLENLSPVARSGYTMVQRAQSISYPLDAQISSEAFAEIRRNLPFILENQKTIDEVLNAAYRLHKLSIYHKR